MKKILFALSILVMFQFPATAQGVHIGLKITPNIGWTSADDAKFFKNNGANVRMGYGLITEFPILKVFHLATGVEFNWYGGKTICSDSTMFYVPTDLSAANTRFKYLLSERTYKVNYFEVPLCLKMRTPAIGPFIYFAQFGVQLGIRGKALAQDAGTLIKTVEKINNRDTSVVSQLSENRPDVDVRSDFNLFRASLNVGAGMEYKLVGPTALMLSVNYMNAFTNLLKSSPEQLKTSRLTSAQTLQTVLKSNAVVINVGILF